MTGAECNSAAPVGGGNERGTGDEEDTFAVPVWRSEKG